MDPMLAGTSGSSNRLARRAASGGTRRVAHIFVPGYAAADGISLKLRSPRRAIARRQMARLIEPRRLSS
jgi:hypothetical protein